MGLPTDPAEQCGLLCIYNTHAALLYSVLTRNAMSTLLLLMHVCALVGVFNSTLHMQLWRKAFTV